MRVYGRSELWCIRSDDMDTRISAWPEDWRGLVPDDLQQSLNQAEALSSFSSLTRVYVPRVRKYKFIYEDRGQKSRDYRV